MRMRVLRKIQVLLWNAETKREPKGSDSIETFVCAVWVILKFNSLFATISIESDPFGSFGFSIRYTVVSVAAHFLVIFPG